MRRKCSRISVSLLLGDWARLIIKENLAFILTALDEHTKKHVSLKYIFFLLLNIENDITWIFRPILDGIGSSGTSSSHGFRSSYFLLKVIKV